jgi:hypothetical protein
MRYNTVHVLTVSRNVERQEQVRREWAGWDIQFHYGYDYRDLNCPEPYNRQFALACCWCGHHKIWGELADEKGWHLIIEDDAFPKPGIRQAIRMIQTEEHNFQIVKLYHYVEPSCEIYLPNGFQKQQLLDLKENAEYRKGNRDWVSTAAYLVRNTHRARREILFATPDLAVHLSTLNVGGIWPLVANVKGESIIGLPDKYDTSPTNAGLAGDSGGSD